MVLTLAFCATAMSAEAQWSRVGAEVTTSLARAADDGPVALLDALAAALAANPELAADRTSAVALARAAAGPVRGFLGANLPVYRAIVQRIAAAAPEQARAAVSLAVAEEVARIAEADPRAAPTVPAVGPAATIPAERPETQSGIRIGSFMLYPDLQAGVFHDSNIFATRRGARSDIVGVISPSVTLGSDWGRHSLTVEGQIDVTRYRRYSAEDSIDWRGSVEGRIDATEATQIYIGALALRDHEDRTSPDAVAGTEPTIYYERRAYAGLSQRFGDITLRLGGAVERITFDDVPSTGGPINNSDRDRNRYTFGVLVRHRGDRFVQPYVEVMGDNRRYDDARDDFGYERTSTGYRAGVGAQFRFSSDLTGEAFVGLMQQNYRDARFSTVTALAATASLRWEATASTRLTAFLDRSIEETTLPGSPAYVYSVLGLRVEQLLIDRLSVIGRATVVRSDFAQVARVDDEVDLSIGLRYRVTRELTVGGDYRFTQRDSNVDNADFNRHQIFLRLGAAF